MTCGIYEFKIGPHSYIGSSKNCETRLKGHELRLRNKKHKNDFAQNAYNKYGEFESQVIFVCAEDELRNKEGMLQRFFKPDLCHRIENEDADTYIYDEVARAKMSAKAKGKKMSDETKAKISAAKKGKKKSEETKARMSAAQKGKLKSDEMKAKLSASQKGIKRGPRGPYKKRGDL